MSTAATPADAPSANLGAVFTRRWIVEMVLDLAGYVADADLSRHTAIEPSVGTGAFITVMVERLLAHCRGEGIDPRTAVDALRGYDIDPRAVDATRGAVSSILLESGLDDAEARFLAETWILERDFLLERPEPGSARWVVGNPPYIRVEDVAPGRMADYRARWATMSGRADVYVGFMEHSLDLLEPDGRMAFICADRWMRNRYGAAIRGKIEADFAVEACVVLHDVDAFEEQVAAYPAVVSVRAGAQGSALIAEATPAFDAAAAKALVGAFDDGPGTVPTHPAFSATWSPGWFTGTGSWPSGTPHQLAELNDLEARFAPIEDTGVRISVGIATGADSIYVTRRLGKIEPARLVRAVSAKEIATGRIQWNEQYLVNPWGDDGLADLTDSPGMRAYFNRHAKRLKARYVARKSPRTWWRTIDRVPSDLATRRKLLIPDLKDSVFPVLDEGDYVPLHSLYYVTSETWDLEVLGGLLMSDQIKVSVESYSVRMASGYLRVSAQYLRKARAPRYEDIPDHVRAQLREAFKRRDPAAATAAAAAVYTP